MCFLHKPNRRIANLLRSHTLLNLKGSFFFPPQASRVLGCDVPGPARFCFILRKAGPPTHQGRPVQYARVSTSSQNISATACDLHSRVSFLIRKWLSLQQGDPCYMEMTMFFTGLWPSSYGGNFSHSGMSFLMEGPFL